MTQILNSLITSLLFLDRSNQSIEKAREFQKNIYFYFIDYANVFVWNTVNCGKFWKRWGY